MAVNKDILNKIAALKAEAERLSLGDIKSFQGDESEEDGVSSGDINPAVEKGDFTGGEEIALEEAAPIDPVEEALKIEDLGRTIALLEAGLKSSGGFLKTPGFWSTVFSYFGSLKNQGLNPSLNPEVIKFNESLNYEGGIVSANEKAASSFRSFVEQKNNYFKTYFKEFLDFLQRARLVSSNDIAQSEDLRDMKDLRVQYDLSLVNTELGVLNSGATINVASTIIKDINAISKNIIDNIRDLFYQLPKESNLSAAII